jgi:hypothetical protein
MRPGGFRLCELAVIVEQHITDIDRAHLESRDGNLLQIPVISVLSSTSLEPLFGSKIHVNFRASLRRRLRIPWDF